MTALERARKKYAKSKYRMAEAWVDHKSGYEFFYHGRWEPWSGFVHGSSSADKIHRVPCRGMED